MEFLSFPFASYFYFRRPLLALVSALLVSEVLLGGNRSGALEDGGPTEKLLGTQSTATGIVEVEPGDGDLFKGEIKKNGRGLLTLNRKRSNVVQLADIFRALRRLALGTSPCS